jgi:SET domain-containing protein 6
MDLCPSPYLAISFNHKTDGEHVHFTKSEESDSDDEEDDDDQSNADSDQEDGDDQSNASADEQLTVENSTTKPSGYCRQHGYNLQRHLVD